MQSVAVPRRAKPKDLKYHGVVVAIPSARASPHSRSRVVFALSPLCRTLPSCPRLHLLHDMLAAAMAAAARALVQSCELTCACRDSSICVSTASCAAPHTTRARVLRFVEAVEFGGVMTASAASSAAVPRIVRSFVRCTTRRARTSVRSFVVQHRARALARSFHVQHGARAPLPGPPPQE